MFCYVKLFAWGGGGGGDGGGLRKNVCQMLETINFLTGEIAGKTLSVRKNFTLKPSEVI